MKNTLKVKQWLKSRKNLPQFEFITPTRVKRIKDCKIFQIGQMGYAKEIVSYYIISDFNKNQIDVSFEVERPNCISTYTWDINWL
jgi:hypothetical protein